MGQRYRRMEDLKSLLAVCTLPGFWKGRGLILIIEKCKYLALATCGESLYDSNVSQPGVCGRGPPAAGGFGGRGRSPQPLGDFM